MRTILDLKKVKAGDFFTGEIAILKDAAKQTYKKNGADVPFLKGQLEVRGVIKDFVIWDNATFTRILATISVGSPVHVHATVSLYKDAPSLNPTNLIGVVDITPEELSELYVSLDCVALKSRLLAFIKDNCTEKASIVVSKILDTQIGERFCLEYAGTAMHDAIKGGLCNHTIKMLEIAKTLFANDARLATTVSKDFLYLSIFFHDIGKVIEYTDGERKFEPYLTHRLFGVEIVHDMKAELIEMYSTTFYYHILEIIIGHHGDYGDKSNTVWSTIIHLIDMVDSTTTHILDTIEHETYTLKANGVKTIYNNGVNLHI